MTKSARVSAPARRQTANQASRDDDDDEDDYEEDAEEEEEDDDETQIDSEDEPVPPAPKSIREQKRERVNRNYQGYIPFSHDNLRFA